MEASQLKVQHARVMLVSVIMMMVVAHAKAQTDPAIARLNEAVANLTRQLDALADRIALLESEAGPGSTGAGATINWTPDGGPGGRPGPGVSGIELMTFVRQLPPEFWSVSGSSMYVENGQIRLDVPFSPEGLELLHSPSFTRVFADSDPLSGVVRLPNRGAIELAPMPGQPEVRFEFHAVPGGDGVELQFDRLDPASLQDFFRHIAPAGD